MESEWEMTSNYIDGQKLYAVYRLRDVSEIDHSGNREFATGYITDRDEAKCIANKLNEKGRH